ncbi:MAG: type II secretion system protein GspL [Betaproteobacteria bacterium]|nr:type II secretion system protein GspL [Betaproteobacteria bacterium]
MTMLRLYPDASGENFDWALLDNTGHLIRTGTNDLPQAEKCEIILPASMVLLTRVKIPKANKNRQAALLSFAIEEQLISEPEMNHVALGGHFPDGAAALAVIDKAWLVHLLARLKTSHLSPVRAVPETLLVSLEPLSWAIVWTGASGFLRTGEFSGIALDGNGNEAPVGLQLALREAAAPKKIVCHTTGTEIPDIDQWSMQLGIPIERGKDWDWKKEGASCPINLLQGEFGSKQLNLTWLPKLRPALIMLFLMLALQFFGIVVDWARLTHEKTKLSAGMTRLFRASFPDASVVVDAPLQMTRKLAELKHAAGFQEAGDFLPLLAGVSPLLAALPRGELKGIDYETGKLGLSIEVPGTDSAESLQKKWAASGLNVMLDKQAPAANGNGVIAYFTVSSEGS